MPLRAALIQKSIKAKDADLEREKIEESISFPGSPVEVTTASNLEILRKSKSIAQYRC